MKIGNGFIIKSNLPGLKGALTLRDKIGMGGTAEVWTANHTSGARLAVKLVLHRDCDGLSLCDRAIQERKASVILDEARIIQTLSDLPNVIGIYGAETIGSFSLEEAVMRAYQVGLVIKEMHKNDLLHGDIKADDIFVLNNGETRMLDFSIAAILDNYKHIDRWYSGFLGTPHYMAPEIVNGGVAHSVASDIYALGVLLYFLVYTYYPHFPDLVDEFLTALENLFPNLRQG